LLEQRHVFIAAAVVRRGEEILLVRQQGQTDPVETWSLPGGVVESGELPTEALLREVREETGLILADVGRLLYVKTSVDPSSASRGTTFVFDLEIGDPPSDLRPADPDGHVREARFFEVADAIARLRRLPRRMMREPLIAHLLGDVQPGALWLYNHGAGDEVTLIGMVGVQRQMRLHELRGSL
jgi:8-oxo-dGTP diphosphatase